MGGHGDCTWMVIYLLQGQNMNKIHYYFGPRKVLQSKDNTHCSCACSQSEQLTSKAQMILHTRRLKDVQTIERDLQKKARLDSYMLSKKALEICSDLPHQCCAAVHTSVHPPKC